MDAIRLVFNHYHDTNIFVHELISKKFYSTGFTSTGFMISSNYVIELSIFNGYHKSFLNSIIIYDRSSSKILHSIYDIKSVSEKSIEVYIKSFLRLQFSMDNFRNLEMSTSFLEQNIQQLFNQQYQENNLIHLLTFLESS